MRPLWSLRPPLDFLRPAGLKILWERRSVVLVSCVSTAAPTTSIPTGVSPVANSGHSSPAKLSTPKRNLPGDDLVEDIATGITGLEASSSSSDHPLPLFRSNAAHAAARRLAFAFSARFSTSPSIAYSHVSPSPLAATDSLQVPSPHVACSPGCSASAAHSFVSPSPPSVGGPSGPLSPHSCASHPVSPSLLTAHVSPGFASSS